jgi:predicted dehydrogenase
VRAGGVEIVDSIDELIRRVDAVLIETNDGRPHFDQAIQVLKSGKRTFVDKPMSASLADVIAIFAASRHFKTPVFSSSALRFANSTKAVRKGAIGDVLASDTYSPCVLESTHPDMSWYGIHGIEALFAVMGTGCRTVSRTFTKQQDVAVGVWSNGRIGTYRGMRVGNAAFGGIAFGTLGNQQIGQFDGYEPLVVEIVRFFRGGDPPVSPEETVEIFAFIEAADRSKQQGGVPVEIGPIIESARTEAAKRCNW